jgi:hypothetical protein
MLSNYLLFLALPMAFLFGIMLLYSQKKIACDFVIYFSSVLLLFLNRLLNII